MRVGNQNNKMTDSVDMGLSNHFAFSRHLIACIDNMKHRDNQTQ